ncbi:MAG: methyltransferase [Myxococcota bacterium]|nr:methyltransferase [Myxococcota bacterium]
MRPTEMDLSELKPTEITCDLLTRNWSIFQLKKGHRFSADDLFTADLALRLAPNAQKCLDLGAGIGTVGLLVLNGLPSAATLTMIEAQRISHQLACRTIAHNKLSSRVTAICGDLRNDKVFEHLPKFPLITGSPPYIPVGSGVMSPHPQRAACRMELRGSIADYALRAAQMLSEDGLFVVCFAGQDTRGEAAIKEAGLHLKLRQDVIFRADLLPTITVLAAQKSPCEVNRISPVVIRNAQGDFTDEYMAVRHRLGAPI